MIEQPRNGRNNGSITWRSSFGRQWNSSMIEAQKKVDSEVLRLTTPYVPFDSGELIRSGIRNTVIGSGRVVYKTPYARKLYYSTTFNFRGAPQRGAQWFERMKRRHKQYILLQAREVFNRG